MKMNIGEDCTLCIHLIALYCILQMVTLSVMCILIKKLMYKNVLKPITLYYWYTLVIIFVEKISVGIHKNQCIANGFSTTSVLLHFLDHLLAYQTVCFIFTHPHTWTHIRILVLKFELLSSFVLTLKLN
jgi:hypothetical protein